MIQENSLLIPPNGTVAPRLREFLSILAFLYLQNGKAEKAIDILNALQALSPSDKWTRKALAYAHELGGNHVESLACINKVPEPERSFVAMQLIESRAYWGLGRTEEAKSLTQKIASRMRHLHE